MTKKRNLDQEKVLSTATEIVRNEGIKALTLSRLASELDIRTQSLYNYIANLDELIALVGARLVNKLRQKITDGILGFSGTEALIKFADIARNFLLDEGTLGVIIFYLHEYPKDSPFNTEAQKLVALLNQVIDSSHTNVGTDAPFSHALIGSVLGFVFIETSGFYQDETDASSTESYHQMIKRIITPSGEPA
ncbi:transcriptional regulator [Paucilactobacillus hokkaidonensis JCM 18461]|uniref:Transcriptional regulator n=2 Tax=Paucilactobacillus hokkaidonensis TaxID=1193095 RepID=A0A0A1GY21_9LACO|nr:TetR/AcrR family transcriptional regulator [Paucilactobacillus hokkaidonensis]KRO10376.1 transcription regulator [Paucilactobacillus hokkaidonensis]BAP85833.1 transcriptional regulator [Paucilactobacillus hokkaidonensis JCM 18461]